MTKMKEMSASRIKHQPMGKVAKARISLKKKRAPVTSTSAKRKAAASSSATRN